MALEQPKKPAGGAFGRFMADKRGEFQQQCPGKPVGEIMKLAGEAWKALSAKDKEPYDKAFYDAQVKYKEDLEAFIEAGGVKTKGPAALRTERKKIKLGLKAKAPVEGEEEEEGPPAKRAKIDPDVIAKAKKEHMSTKLVALMERPEVAARNLSASDVLQVLRDAGGKVPDAKRALKSFQPGSQSERRAEASDEEQEHSPKSAIAVDADILAQAKKEGLHLKLQALMARREVTDKMLDANDVLKALQDASGKVPAAKRALLGA